MRYWLLLVATLIASTASASDFYFAPTSAGSNNGTSCGNAYAYNDGTNGWNTAGKQVAGNKLHICPGAWPTFGTNAGAIFTGSQSGSAGNLITLIADQGAVVFAAQYWNGSVGAVNITGQFWLVDGKGNLTIESTLNGSPGGACLGGTCTSNAVSQGMQIVANDTVQNMTVLNICMHVQGADEQSCFGATGIALEGANSTAQFNTVKNVDSGIVAGTSGTGFVVTHNTLQFCNHCVVFGEAGAGSISASSIDNNDISDSYPWDTPSNFYHHDPIFLEANGSGHITATISQNYIHGTLSSAYSGSHPGGDTTAAIFLDFDNRDTVITRNVIALSSTDLGGAVIEAGNEGETTDPIYILGNTFYSAASGGAGPCISTTGGAANKNGLTAEDNIFDNCSGISWLGTGFGTFTVDYNTYFGSSSHAWVFDNAGLDSTFAQWKTDCSCESHSTFGTDPKLSASAPPYTLQATSPVIGAGVNLTSLGFSNVDVGAPLTFGISGACGTGGCVTASATNPWDLGAYPAGGVVALTPSPENFGFVPLGNSALVSFTLTNNSSATVNAISPSVTGGNSGDFVVGNVGLGSCNAAGNTIAVGASCAVAVTFTPSVVGTRSTTLNISYTGGDGASPQTSALTGQGTGQVCLKCFVRNDEKMEQRRGND